MLHVILTGTALLLAAAAGSCFAQTTQPSGTEILLRAGYKMLPTPYDGLTVQGPFRLTSRQIQQIRPSPDSTTIPEQESGDDGEEPCANCPTAKESSQEAVITIQSPAPTSQFTASAGGRIDPQLAASSTHLVAATRDRVAFFTKDGNFAKQWFSTMAFFQPIAQSLNTHLNFGTQYDANDQTLWIDEVFDARVIFDSFRRRFWLAGLARNKLEAHNGCYTSGDKLICPARRHRFVVAISSTEDPLDDWYMYWSQSNKDEDACPKPCSLEFVADYPSIGISSKYFVAEYTAGRKRPDPKNYYRRVLALPADVLFAGAVCNPCKSWAFGNKDGETPFVYAPKPSPSGPACTTGDFLVPAVHHSDFFGMALLASSFRYDAKSSACPGLSLPPYETVVWVLNPDGAAPVFFRQGVPVKPYGSSRDAQQRSNSEVPNPNPVNYGRLGNLIMKAVYRNGLVYAIRGDCQDPEKRGACSSVIRLFRFDLLDPNLASTDPAKPHNSAFIDRPFGIRNFYDDGPNDIVDYAFPSMEVNSRGDMVAVYARAGVTVYPEARYSVYRRNATDLQPSRTLQAGTYPLESNAESKPSSVGPLDTAGASVDPYDDEAIWIATMYSRKVSCANSCYGGYKLAIGKIFGQRHPDLAFDSFVGAAALAHAGDTLTFTAGLRNQGDGDAYRPIVALYWSTDANLTPVDLPVATASYSTLAPGASEVRSITMAVPGVAPGKYYVFAVADPNGTITEYSNTNNLAVVAVQVLVN